MHKQAMENRIHLAQWQFGHRIIERLESQDDDIPLSHVLSIVHEMTMCALGGDYSTTATNEKENRDATQ